MKQNYMATGIPQLLEPRPKAYRKLITLDQLGIIMEHEERAILPVSGDCLEGAGVMDGGWVAVDFTHFPAPPRYKSKGGDGSEDVCLCYAVFSGQRRPTVMCKAYTGVWGPWQMVKTRYDLSKGEHNMNCGMPAKRIFGVVYASWDADGHLVWYRDPGSFPAELGTSPTIHGENIGDPMPIKEAAV